MFRQGNTGTHPNTHCCHAVLDVLFICWIPAQSRSHAFPRARSLAPNTPPPLLPPERAPVTTTTTPALQTAPHVPGPQAAARRVRGPGPAAFHFIFIPVVVAAGLALLFLSSSTRFPGSPGIGAYSSAFLSAPAVRPPPLPAPRPHQPPPFGDSRPGRLRSTDSQQRLPRSPDPAPLPAPRGAPASGEAGRLCPAERSPGTPAGCCLGPWAPHHHHHTHTLHPQAFAWENLAEAKCEVGQGDSPPNVSPCVTPRRTDLEQTVQLGFLPGGRGRGTPTPLSRCGPGDPGLQRAAHEQAVSRSA